MLCYKDEQTMTETEAEDVVPLRCEWYPTENGFIIHTTEEKYCVYESYKLLIPNLAAHSV